MLRFGEHGDGDDEERGGGAEDAGGDRPRARAERRAARDQDGGGVGGEHWRGALAGAGHERCDSGAAEADAPERLVVVDQRVAGECD